MNQQNTKRSTNLTSYFSHILHVVSL